MPPVPGDPPPDPVDLRIPSPALAAGLLSCKRRSHRLQSPPAVPRTRGPSTHHYPRRPPACRAASGARSGTPPPEGCATVVSFQGGLARGVRKQKDGPAAEHSSVAVLGSTRTQLGPLDCGRRKQKEDREKARCAC